MPGEVECTWVHLACGVCVNVPLTMGEGTPVGMVLE